MPFLPKMYNCPTNNNFAFYARAKQVTLGRQDTLNSVFVDSKIHHSQTQRHFQYY